METSADDGAAVGAARSILVSQGLVEDMPWPGTVVAGEADAWVVRTWTRTPPGDARPTGTPDFVHRVSGDMSSVVQVHPT